MATVTYLPFIMEYDGYGAAQGDKGTFKMYVKQSIERPFGINVFGSAVIRVDPDLASLHFKVSRLEQHPAAAFSAAREGAQQVRAFLAQSQIDDFGAGRVLLSQTFKRINGESGFVGYTTTIAFHVLLHDLDRMEEVLAGIVDAGANLISSVELQTSRLKQIRADARRQAVNAAREKAELYCTAAEIKLGPAIHIEDVSPDTLTGRGGDITQPEDHEIQSEDEAVLKAFNPGSITVGAAVMVGYEIGRTS